MSEMLKINVNDHTERKNGLTYLSWAWAWAEVLKIDSDAEWETVEYPMPDGTLVPCMYLIDRTAMVKTKVTIKGRTKACTLPVMDHKNKAIQNPNAFAINTAIMRCMTKAIGMHGLGLYIYAGEDLPEGEAGEEQQDTRAPYGYTSKGLPKASEMPHGGTVGVEDRVDEEQKTYIQLLASTTINLHRAKNVSEICDRMEREELDADAKVYLWSLLPSDVRSAIKREQSARKNPTKETAA